MRDLQDAVVGIKGSGKWAHGTQLAVPQARLGFVSDGGTDRRATWAAEVVRL